jgi:hypothetical protein
MKRLLLAATFALFALSSTFGQSYTTGIGLKGGWPGYGGINLKHDFGGIYGDFTVGGGRYNLSFMALLEKQQALKNGFEWYYGGGLYLYTWKNNYGYYHNNKYYENRASFGAMFVLGLEYTFDEIPINIGLDAGPVVSLTPYAGVGFGSNLAVRYVLK